MNVSQEFKISRPKRRLFYVQNIFLRGGTKMQNAPQWDDVPILLKPLEVAKILRVSKNRVYEIAKIEGFPKLYVGENRYLIPKDALRDWIKNQAGR